MAFSSHGALSLCPTFSLFAVLHCAHQCDGIHGVVVRKNRLLDAILARLDYLRLAQSFGSRGNVFGIEGGLENDPRLLAISLRVALASPMNFVTSLSV